MGGLSHSVGVSPHPTQGHQRLSVGERPLSPDASGGRPARGVSASARRRRCRLRLARESAGDSSSPLVLCPGLPAHLEVRRWTQPAGPGHPPASYSVPQNPPALGRKPCPVSRLLDL